MGALFSILAVICALDAAFVALRAGRSAVDLDGARLLASAAHFILFCGGLCLLAARAAS